jgi:hypothetical protein
MMDDQHIEATESIILKCVATSSQEEFYKLIHVLEQTENEVDKNLCIWNNK